VTSAHPYCLQMVALRFPTARSTTLLRHLHGNMVNNLSHLPPRFCTVSHRITDKLPIPARSPSQTSPTRPHPNAYPNSKSLIDLTTCDKVFPTPHSLAAVVSSRLANVMGSRRAENVSLPDQEIYR
jgi:hypothetical protein